MANSYGFGRDVVLEISPERSQDLLLTAIRTTGSFSCLSRDEVDAVVPGAGAYLDAVGMPGVSIWVNHIHLRRDQQFEPVADLTTVVGGVPPELVPNPLTLPLKGYLSDSLAAAKTALEGPLAGLSATPTSVDLGITDGGALALGVGFAMNQSLDQLAWFKFGTDFLELDGHSHDWALALDAQFVIALILQLARQYDAELSGTSIRIDDVQVLSWYPHIRLYISIHSSDYGGADVVIEADLRLGVNDRSQLVATFGAPDITVRHWAGDLVWLTHGDEIRQAVKTALSAALGQTFPIGLSFDLIEGAHLVATGLAHDEGGIRIVGRMIGPLPPAEPRPGYQALDLWPVPDGACLGYEEAFGADSIRIYNAGHGTLFICDAWTSNGDLMILTWQAPGFQGLQFTTGDWKRVSPPRPIALQAGQVVMGVFEPGDPSRGDRQATVKVLCNAPSEPVFEVQVRAHRVSGGVPRLDPDSVELHVANTPTGVDPGPAPMSECSDFRPPHPQHPQSPVGYFTLHNDGTGPLFLCEIDVQDDPDHVFTTDGGGAPALLKPGLSAQIGVYFRPADVDRRYTARLLVRTTEGDLHANVSGQVDSGQVQKMLPVGLDGATLQSIIDMFGSRLCMPGQPDICRVRGMYEKTQPPGALDISQIEFRGLNDGSTVLIEDEGGRVVVRDDATGPRRPVVVDYPTPDGGVTGRPCIASYQGVREPAGVRVHFISRWLVPEKVSHAGLVAAAGDGETLALATLDGVRLMDAGGADKAERELPGIEQLSISGSDLLLVRNGEVVLIDARDRGLKERRRWPAPGSSTFVLATTSGFLVAAGKELAVHDRDGALAQRLALPGEVSWLAAVGGRAVASGTWGAVEMAPGDGGWRRVVQHMRSHWSRGFCLSAEDNTLVQVVDGRLRLWRWRVRRLDRSRFADLVTLRFHGAPRPAGAARSAGQLRR